MLPSFKFAAEFYGGVGLLLDRGTKSLGLDGRKDGLGIQWLIPPDAGMSLLEIDFDPFDPIQALYGLGHGGYAAGTMKAAELEFQVDR